MVTMVTDTVIITDVHMVTDMASQGIGVLIVVMATGKVTLCSRGYNVGMVHACADRWACSCT